MNAPLLRHVWVVFLALAAAAPWIVSPYELSLLGRFLALSILALGLVLVWGEAGILTLGQGVFFGLGGYVLAMHLKLAALVPGEIPDFMTWSGRSDLPWWWQPFTSPWVALAAVIVVPAVFAALFAWAVFRRRVVGVYFALITQALALCFATLLVSQQESTGGFNGLTDFSTLLGFDLAAENTVWTLYWITVAFVTLSYLGLRWLMRSRFGTLLRATRDGENRVRFLGHNPTPYKVVAFSVSAVLAGIGGALFTLHAGVVSPALVGVVPSIEMVIWVAVGGRGSLWGAVAGTLLVNFAKDEISSALPDAWLYVLGLVFILVVTLMPRGVAGVVEDALRRLRPVAPGGKKAAIAAPAGATMSAATLAADPGTQLLLSVDGVTVDFDGFKALNGFSMTLDRGALRVLIGPNGAGKSTLCDTIIGRVRATSGHVYFKGEDITYLPEYQIVQRGICRKFQTPGVLPSLTVLDNLLIAAHRDRRWWRSLTAAPSPAERVRADEVLEKVGLAERRDMLAGELAHGEKQWLEIGMVVATDADLLLLDEPTAGMGPAETAKTAELIHSLLGRHAVLVIDHDMSFVEQLGGRVTVLHQGQFLKEGSVAQIRQDPDVAAVYLGRLEH